MRQAIAGDDAQVVYAARDVLNMNEPIGGKQAQRPLDAVASYVRIILCNVVDTGTYDIHEQAMRTGAEGSTLLLISDQRMLEDEESRSYRRSF